MWIVRVFAKISGPVPLQPKDFWADRLRGERVAAAIEQRLLADSLPSAPSISFAGASVDAIEHGIHQRLASRVDWQHAGADGAASDRPDGGGATLLSASSLRVMKVRSSHQSSFGRCSAQPGCGTIISCGLAALATISAVRIDKDTFRFERADIDAEVMPHWMKSSRSRENLASIRCKAAMSSRVSCSRSPRSQTSSDECV